MDLPATSAFTCALAFDAGARAELAEENGVAHLLEHVVFRGGDRYPTARAIGHAARGLGAALGGYVTHDLVVYHVTVRIEDAHAAVDLLSDIVGNPKLDPADVRLEQDVVSDEISRRRERPEVLADELLDRAVFGDHPLGRPVVGEERIVGSLTADHLRAFRHGVYAPPRGIAVLAGNVGRALEAELAPLLLRIPETNASAEVPAAPREANEMLVERRAEGRAHLRLAYRPKLDVHDIRQRAALKVLASILGGSAGSRLYDDLRTERGLTYAVFASDRTGSDYALLTLSAEVNADRSREALTLMRQHVERLRAEPPAESEVDQARRSTAGRRVLALEQARAVAQYVARQRILFRQPVDPQDAVRSIEAVTPEDVARVAHALPEDFALASVGPPSLDEIV